MRRSPLGLFMSLAAAIAAAEPPVSYQIDGDAIKQSLTGQAGNAGQGYAIASHRADAGCVLCHQLPGIDAAMSGNLAPSLDGIGRRLSEEQLRLRLVDSSRLNPQTIMPSYYRTEGLRQVAKPYQGKPILTAQQIEDVIAYLLTLK